MKDEKKKYILTIADVQNYVSRRLKVVSLSLTAYEDSLEITPDDDKDSVLFAIGIGRGKIDELERLKEELSLFPQDNKKEGE